MSILRDVLAELFSMFVADARLTAAILAVVAGAAVMIDVARLPALAAGAALLIGTIVVLVASVCAAARRGK